jgi:hypothetical protein
MATPPAPHIRGEERQQLINDLAAGDLTHTELAAKYGGPACTGDR